MTADEIVHTHRSLDQETLVIEIGTPGRNGAVKIRGPADDPDQMKLRIDNAFALRAYALEYEQGARSPAPVDDLATSAESSEGGLGRSPVNGMPSNHLIKDKGGATEKATASALEASPDPAGVSEGEGVCEQCGGRVPAPQAKVSRMFAGKVLCKECMPVQGGGK